MCVEEFIPDKTNDISNLTLRTPYSARNNVCRGVYPRQKCSYTTTGMFGEGVTFMTVTQTKGSGFEFRGGLNRVETA